MKRVAVGLLITAGLGLAFARWRAEPILADVSFSRLVLARSGETLRLTLSGEEKFRVRTRLEEVSPRFVDALLLLEDRHYWSHPGLNPVALLRAAFSTWSGGPRMGASTLTMQVARLKHGLRTRDWRGKLLQIGSALMLELLHSKREILEAYLNLAPYGANVEGIGAASRIYFGKAPKDLTIDESLALAVVPQSPGARGFANEAARRPYERLRDVYLAVHPGRGGSAHELPDLTRRISALPFRAPHFVNEALAHNPGQSVLRTSLDLRVQQAWERRLRDYLRRQAPLGIRNASALLLNYETMQVEAWIGSADFFDESISGQVDGITARRSPGSTIKPFAYALALDQGLIHSETVLKDTPSSFGAFDPENFDGEYLGPVSATQALIESRNVPAVYLSSRLASPSLYEFLKENRIFLPKSSSYYGLSVVLGGAEMSLLEVAGLYATLARQGNRVAPSLLSGATPAGVPSGLSPEASYIVLDMLTQNQPPKQKFPREWLRRPFPVAWKTGTSRGFRDAWTVGVAGPYVAAVWVGNFDNQSNQALVGREMAAPLFFELLDTLDKRRLESPAFLNHLGLNVRKESVCALSGHLPGAHCPAKKPAFFIPGKSPISECQVHRPLLVSRATGHRVCHPSPGSAVERVFEFWPSDFLQLFRGAGLARKTPPPFDGSCTQAERAMSGQAPQIVSPKNQVTYNLRIGAGDELNTIPLRAVADADVRKLFWYAGNRYLGANEPEKALFWKAEPGDYTIRVVDEFGRADARPLAVRVVR